jgi:MutS domain V
VKPNLMHADADFDVSASLPSNTGELMQDLGLGIICNAMAQSDRLVLDSAKRALLLGLSGPGEISYRQQVLGDCLDNAEVVRQLFRTAVDVVEAERRVWGLYSGAPQSILSRALNASSVLLGGLRELRRTSDEHASSFSSEGFARFFKTLSDELDDEYLERLEAHLEELQFQNGLLLSARLGPGNSPAGFALRRPGPDSPRPRQGRFNRSLYTFEVPARDDAGMRALEDLRAHGLNLVANALAQSAEHVRGFFTQLSSELAFYVGCLNLASRLGTKQAPWCFPTPSPVGTGALHAEGLYDAGLALRQSEPVVGNDLRADGKMLVMVTGANQGGKSTFLRSTGLAQLMMQAGMFVPAANFAADICRGVFTHFKREEDPAMKHGKLDEELARMSAITEHMKPGCLLLCNESFASTNEREGSEIARQVIKAMTASDIKVVFVTHMFELAEGLFVEGARDALFLRAERLADGQRTFRLVEGEPLSTSFGQDSYWRVFGPRSPDPSRTMSGQVPDVAQAQTEGRAGGDEGAGRDEGSGP